jgi:hypothetical protein
MRYAYMKLLVPTDDVTPDLRRSIRAIDPEAVERQSIVVGHTAFKFACSPFLEVEDILPKVPSWYIMARE